MNQNVYLQQYKKNTVETASPEELLIMLFNALVNYVAKARTAISTANIQDTHNNITAAQNILIEFIDTLDHSVNPSLAKNLESLYTYNIQLLATANIKKDLKKIDESYNMLKDLRDTWKKAAELSKSGSVEKNTESVEEQRSLRAVDNTEYDDEDDTPDEEYTGYEFDG